MPSTENSTAEVVSHVDKRIDIMGIDMKGMLEEASKRDAAGNRSILEAMLKNGDEVKRQRTEELKAEAKEAEARERLAKKESADEARATSREKTSKKREEKKASKTKTSSDKKESTTSTLLAKVTNIFSKKADAETKKKGDLDTTSRDVDGDEDPDRDHHHRDDTRPIAKPPGKPLKEQIQKAGKHMENMWLVYYLAMLGLMSKSMMEIYTAGGSFLKEKLKDVVTSGFNAYVTTTASAAKLGLAAMFPGLQTAIVAAENAYGWGKKKLGVGGSGEDAAVAPAESEAPLPKPKAETRAGYWSGGSGEFDPKLTAGDLADKKLKKPERKKWGYNHDPDPEKVKEYDDWLKLQKAKDKKIQFIVKHGGLAGSGMTLEQLKDAPYKFITNLYYHLKSQTSLDKDVRERQKKVSSEYYANKQKERDASQKKMMGPEYSRRLGKGHGFGTGTPNPPPPGSKALLKPLSGDPIKTMKFGKNKQYYPPGSQQELGGSTGYKTPEFMAADRVTQRAMLAEWRRKSRTSSTSSKNMARHRNALADRATGSIKEKIQKRAREQVARNQRRADEDLGEGYRDKFGTQTATFDRDTGVKTYKHIPLKKKPTTRDRAALERHNRLEDERYPRVTESDEMIDRGFRSERKREDDSPNEASKNPNVTSINSGNTTNYFTTKEKPINEMFNHDF